MRVSGEKQRQLTEKSKPSEVGIATYNLRVSFHKEQKRSN